jgi:hypothetical protein
MIIPGFTTLRRYDINFGDKDEMEFDHLVIFPSHGANDLDNVVGTKESYPLRTKWKVKNGLMRGNGNVGW